MKTRVWTNFAEVQEYVRRTVALTGNSLVVVGGATGWTIPNHYSHANGGYPEEDSHFDESDDESPIIEYGERAPSHLVPGWLGGTFDVD